MNLIDRVKATVVGLHADWYTDFRRWRKPAGPGPGPQSEDKPDDGPTPPKGVSRATAEVITRPLYDSFRATSGKGIHFIGDDPYVERIVTKMKELGWTNVTPAFTGYDNFTLHGTFQGETGYFQPVFKPIDFHELESQSYRDLAIANAGNILGVRTCSAYRDFTPEEPADVAV